jgi:hypothetical protein
MVFVLWRRRQRAEVEEEKKEGLGVIVRQHMMRKRKWRVGSRWRKEPGRKFFCLC